jgi:hypothetical protein
MCPKCQGDVTVDIYPMGEDEDGYDIYCAQCGNRKFGSEIESLLIVYRETLKDLT